MAHQIIFTSSVRGIKPGASGYCTVLRSPEIRPALEQALEKISVFEHSQCNQGRTIYSYRNLAIRDKAYHVLSRVSDAGKDYTGRTNFLAHHLVFEKEELPEQSPGDLLLYWPHWCKKWEGEPREAPVDSGSIKNTVVTKPPVKMWREQGSGIDGAVRLANETDTSLILRSKTRTDETLLQLIVEALAVRAKFNKSSAFAWTTSFSVGLAVQGHAKNFRWLALRASDDYSLPSSGEVFDLDAAVSGPSSANEELIAIAREGHFKPPQKPIPLTHERGTSDRSVPIQGAKPSQQIPTKRKIKLGLGDGRRSNRHVGDTGGATATKRSVKKPVLALVTLLLILSVFAGGYWFYQLQKTSAANTEYEKQIELMIDLNDQWKRDGDTAISIGKVEELFKNIHDAAGRPTKTHKDMMNIEWERLSRDYDEREKEIATYAFQEFIEILKNPNRLADKRKENIGVESPLYESEKTDLPKAEMAATGSETSSRSESSAPAETDEEDQVALNLNDYGEIIFREVGDEIRMEKDLNARFMVASNTAQLPLLTAEQFTNETQMAPDGKTIPGSDGHSISINGRVPNGTTSTTIQMHSDTQGKKLFLILGKDWTKSVAIGTFKLPKSTAAHAIKKLESVFKLSSIEMQIVDKADKEFRPLSSTGNQSDGARKPIESTIHQLLDAIVTHSVSAESLEEVLANFEKIVSQEIIKHLDDLIEEVDDEPAGPLDEKFVEDLKRLLRDAYKSIKQEIKKQNFSVGSYFTAYEAELKDLEEAKKQTDKSRRAPYDRALTLLSREHYGDNKIQIEPEPKKTYVVTWQDDTWKVQYEDKHTYHGLTVRDPISRESLFDYLPHYIEYIEKEERRKIKESNNEKERKQFNEVTREWKRIEFKRPGPDGQIVATVEVK